MDASLEGLGACWNGKGYAIAIPQWVKMNRCIAHYEIYNVVVVFAKWAREWMGWTVRVRSDNMAVVHALNSLGARDEVFGMCIRNILMIIAKYTIHCYTVHIPGAQNDAADALSRLVIDWEDNKWVLNHVVAEEVPKARSLYTDI